MQPQNAGEAVAERSVGEAVVSTELQLGLNLCSGAPTAGPDAASHAPDGEELKSAADPQSVLRTQHCLASFAGDSSVLARIPGEERHEAAAGDVSSLVAVGVA